MPTSDFWTSLLYFVLQVALALAGIWIGIYLYLRQEKRERDRNDERMLAYMKEINKQLTVIRSSIGSLNTAANHTQMELLETQRKLLFRLAETKRKRKPKFTEADFPTLVNSRK